MTIEICLDSPAGILAAERGGAHRIEVCSSLAEGGLTPSSGLIDFACRKFSGDVMVMLRPRGGDFLYSDAEMVVVLGDLEAARRAKVKGVVFGALTAAGDINQTQLAQIMDAAGSMEVTFHRAFDVCRDLSAALEILIRHQVTRVLTSGGEPNVEAGSETLAKLVNQAAGRIKILAGGGLSPSLIPLLAAKTGCAEFHLSARTGRDSAMQYRREDIPMGSSQLSGDYFMKEADEAVIRAAVEQLPSRV